MVFSCLGHSKVGPLVILSEIEMKFCILLLLAATVSVLYSQNVHPVYMGNGIKIGEASATSAIVWARLTAAPERNRKGISWNKSSVIPEGSSLGEMHDALAGSSGEIQVAWSLDDHLIGETDWLKVDSEKDFTRQVSLTSLSPGKKYSVRVSSRTLKGETGQSVNGSFYTAPSQDEAAPVKFTVVTGQEYSRRDNEEKGHQIYPQMQKQDPHFFVHTGDIVYYDFKGSEPKATNEALARFKWNRLYALPFQRAFHNEVGSYFIKDDHDTVRNDCWPPQSYGDLTWKEGVRIFREQVPMGEKTYRTIRWGKDLQVWFVEGRDFRSPNTMPDGPEKTIWGEEQKEWFFDTVKKSDATFRILISPTPIVGPDRGGKNDNHANKGFTHEGKELRAFIASQKNMYVVCGDRHWQYVSVDPETGVREYSCGSTSDKHAGGFSEKYRSAMHQYLKVKGGFLSVEIRRDQDLPVATFQHHGVDGTVYHTDVVEAK